MRIILCHDLVHLPALGGANKANRRLLEALANRNECFAVVRSTGLPRPTSRVEFEHELSGSSAVEVRHFESKTVYKLNGVEIHAIHDKSSTGVSLRAHFAACIRDLKPDIVLVGSEDRGFRLLATAQRHALRRTVLLAQTASVLPFGPASGPPQAQLLERMQATPIVAISQFLVEYMQKYGGLQAKLLRYPVFEAAPPESLISEREVVTFVNPSTIKGLPIFLGIASARPEIRFRAVPTWATTSQDLDALVGLSNVEIVNPTEDISELLRTTRVLLAPSLWYETFGYIVVEAMQRGIPVLASDVGGLREAKLGVPYLIPINPLSGDTTGSDAAPREWQLTPWLDALDRLHQDDAHYEDIATRSKKAAQAFVAGIHVSEFEKYFAELSATSSFGGVAVTQGGD